MNEISQLSSSLTDVSLGEGFGFAFPHLLPLFMIQFIPPLRQQ